MKMVFIDPYFNHTAGLVGDKWFAPRMGTDVALGLAIAFVWLTEGLYDKEYVATRTHGFDEWKALRAGRERRRAQDAGVGRDREHSSPPARSGRWPGSGAPRRPCWPPAAWAAGAAPAAPPTAPSGPAP